MDDLQAMAVFAAVVQQGSMSAAARTLGKFVFDFVRTNPTIYDSVALPFMGTSYLYLAAGDGVEVHPVGHAGLLGGEVGLRSPLPISTPASSSVPPSSERVMSMLSVRQPLASESPSASGQTPDTGMNKVQPAASLPRMALACGAKVIEVNPEETELSASASIFMKGKAGEVLPRLV